MNKTSIEVAVDAIGPVPVVPRTFRDFAAVGAVEDPRIQSTDQGFLVLMNMGSHERVLGHSRGHGARYFKSLDGAAAALTSAGIVRWHADTTGWTPRTRLSDP